MPIDSPSGTPEQALDHACGPYLGDPPEVALFVRAPALVHFVWSRTQGDR